jgi:hypothetical protein
MKLIVIFLLLCSVVLAQPVYQEAPEKWSKPVKIPSIQAFRPIWCREPTVSWDGKTIYFLTGQWGDFYYTTLTDTGWSFPKRMPGQIHPPISYATGKLIISPDNKMLLFTAGLTGQIGISFWNDSLNDWDSSYPLRDNGIGTGYPSPVWGVVNFLNDTTVILYDRYEGRITYFNKETRTFSRPKNFPTECCPIFAADGAWISPDKKKYYGVDWGQGGSSNLDLTVSYFDSSSLGHYKFPYKLNISFMSDSLFYIGEYRGRSERFPFLTPDGKTMFFNANYDSGGNYFTIYMSKMIIDENGDSVLTNIDEKTKSIIPEELKLLPAYPNPFNSQTILSYKINKRTMTELRVYNILGKEVKKLVEEEKDVGEYKIDFNAEGLPSGVYLAILKTNYGIKSTKLILLK